MFEVVDDTLRVNVMLYIHVVNAKPRICAHQRSLDYACRVLQFIRIHYLHSPTFVARTLTTVSCACARNSPRIGLGIVSRTTSKLPVLPLHSVPYESYEKSQDMPLTDAVLAIQYHNPLITKCYIVTCCMYM